MEKGVMAMATLQERTAAATELSRAMACVDFSRDGRLYVNEADVLRECLVTVRLNGAAVLRLACTPTDLEELVLGRLHTEGLLDDGRAVASLTVREGADGTVVAVETADGRRPDATQAVPFVPTAGMAGEARAVVGPVPLVPLPPRTWCTGDVFALCDQFAADTPLHARTSGTHSCRLAVDGELVYTAEDIGRHNALDKVVGRMLREGIEPGRCVAFTSGRVPTDMAVKAIRARIPVLASKAAPTDEAVALARTCSLVLVCKADSRHLRVFSGADLAY